MNILEGKQSIQDIQRQFTALLYWPNCNFKTLSLDLCILFKVVLWVFFRGNDCLMTRKWVTINQLSSFIEPSSIWIAIKVSVTGNTARRNRPKLILFCFSVAALPVAKNEKDFVYLFIFSICTEVCADGTSDNLITFARHPHPLLCPTALDMTGSQSEHITLALRGMKIDLFHL